MEGDMIKTGLMWGSITWPLCGPCMGSAWALLEPLYGLCMGGLLAATDAETGTY